MADKYVATFRFLNREHAERFARNCVHSAEIMQRNSRATDVRVTVYDYGDSVADIACHAVAAGKSGGSVLSVRCLPGD